MILSSSSLTLLRIKCSPIISRNFSRVSLFPAKGVIFPPFILLILSSVELFIVHGLFVVSGFGVVRLLVLSSAWKNCSVGALSSGVV